MVYSAAGQNGVSRGGDREPSLPLGSTSEGDLTLHSVLAQVSASIVRPRDDRPYEGFLIMNSEISPMASSVYEAGR